MPQVLHSTNTVEVSQPIYHHLNASMRPPTIFFCETDDNGVREFKHALQDVLPEYVLDGQLMIGNERKRPHWFRLQRLTNTNEYDIFIGTYNMWCPASAIRWLSFYFRGKIVFASGESEKVRPTLHSPSEARGKQLYTLGVVPKELQTSADMTVTYMQWTYWALFRPHLPPERIMRFD